MALSLPALLVASTFSALFNNALKDPFLVDGDYDSCLAPFNITIAAGGTNKTPNTI
jgi:hypothetical protein